MKKETTRMVIGFLARLFICCDLVSFSGHFIAYCNERTNRAETLKSLVLTEFGNIRCRKQDLSPPDSLAPLQKLLGQGCAGTTCRPSWAAFFLRNSICCWQFLRS